MEFKQAADLMARLRAKRDGAGATPLELESAGMIETLLFQLQSRIEVAKKEVA